MVRIKDNIYIIFKKQVGNERRIFGNRKEDSIMSRLRIGLSALNHSLYNIENLSLDFV